MSTPITGPSRRIEPRHLTIRPRSPLRSRIALVVVAGAVGLLIGVQARQEEQGRRLVAETPEDLTRVLADLNEEADVLGQQVAALRVRLLRYRSSTTRSEVALQDARKELADLEVLAGSVAVAGPGVRVRLSDPSGRIGWDHILDLVQELRDAGAEAIAVNGHRVVASTWFGSGGPGVSVNGAVVHPPYVLEAIGDPRAVRRALEIPGGPVSIVAALSGVQVGLEEADTLMLPPLRHEIAFRYARPTS